MLSLESPLSSASEPPRQVSSFNTQISQFSMTKTVVMCKNITSLPYILLLLYYPPYASSAINEFVLIPQHTTPANTTKELDALYDVLQYVRRIWKIEVRGTKIICQFSHSR